MTYNLSKEFTRLNTKDGKTKYECNYCPRQFIIRTAPKFSYLDSLSDIKELEPHAKECKKVK